jgi:hypothetical protein
MLTVRSWCGSCFHITCAVSSLATMEGMYIPDTSAAMCMPYLYFVSLLFNKPTCSRASQGRVPVAVCLAGSCCRVVLYCVCQLTRWLTSNRSGRAVHRSSHLLQESFSIFCTCCTLVQPAVWCFLQWSTPMQLHQYLHRQQQHRHRQQQQALLSPLPALQLAGPPSTHGQLKQPHTLLASASGLAHTWGTSSSLQTSLVQQQAV